jgi:hypothetical protein
MVISIQKMADTLNPDARDSSCTSRTEGLGHVAVLFTRYPPLLRRMPWPSLWMLRGCCRRHSYATMLHSFLRRMRPMQNCVPAVFEPRC